MATKASGIHSVPANSTRKNPPHAMLGYFLTAMLAFASGFAIALLLNPLLPPSETRYPYAAIAASFLINLASLALALTWLPAEKAFTAREHLPHLRAWLHTSFAVACAYAGLWIAPVHGESMRVFVALALLTAAQAGALFALHAALIVLFGEKSRAPRTLCALLLCVLSSALFWSREPIERLSKSGGDGSLHSGYLADGVMKLSPPMSTAAAWYQESDGARTPQSASSRRFDVIHGTLTYAVWIGSYQAVACPDILPSGGSGDYYDRREFSAGIVLAMFAWALPFMALCDILMQRKTRSARALPIAAST